jgi:DNA adenine methylase
MDDGPALVRRIENTTPTLELFRNAQEAVADALAGTPADLFDLGFAAFLINRCSRSVMVIPSVGPIGGRTQSGPHTIGARFNAPALAERVRTVHALGDRFKVFAGDGISLLEDLPDSGVQGEVFCFVDPPYIGVGSPLYAVGMDDALHRRLAGALNILASPWLLTYDAYSQVPLLYPERSVVRFDIPQTAGSSFIGTEYLALGPGLALPDTNPLGKGHIELLAA